MLLPSPSIHGGVTDVTVRPRPSEPGRLCRVCWYCPCCILAAAADVSADFEQRLRTGGLGYGDLKKALFEHYWNYFAAARAKRVELLANLDYVEGALHEGAARARAVASVVLKRARKACGLE